MKKKLVSVRTLSRAIEKSQEKKSCHEISKYTISNSNIQLKLASLISKVVTLANVFAKQLFANWLLLKSSNFASALFCSDHSSALHCTALCFLQLAAFCLAYCTRNAYVDRREVQYKVLIRILYNIDMKVRMPKQSYANEKQRDFFRSRKFPLKTGKFPSPKSLQTNFPTQE